MLEYINKIPYYQLFSFLHGFNFKSKNVWITSNHPKFIKNLKSQKLALEKQKLKKPN